MLDFLISAVSTIDGATVAVGVTAVAAKIPIRQILGHKPIFSSSGCASDLLNGVTLVPFGLMVGSAFFPNLLEHLAKTNIVLIAVSGGIGIFFVLGELLKAP